MTEDESKFTREAWQSQRENPMIFQEEERKQLSERLARQVRLRNSVEYIAAAVIALVNAFYIGQFHSMVMKAGSALMIAGVVYVVLQLHRQGSADSVQSTAAPSLEFLIGELKRQRDLLWKVWDWYLLPLFPGITVFLFGISMMRGTDGSRLVPERSIVFTVALVVVGFALIAFANRRVSRRIEYRIEALKRLLR